MNLMTDTSIVALAFLGALAVGCGSDSNPASPSAPAAPRLTAQLSPANEVPPIANADASASGTVTVTLNVTRDAAQNITAATADFQVNMTGFPAGTTLTGAHIHPGRAGVNGGVIVNLGVTAGEFTLATGATSFSRTAITVAPDVAQGILADPAAFYFNVHTTLNTGGAIRGQLARQ